MRVAAVVVLYNPDERVASNIQSYLSSVHTLFIVDNSESVHTRIPQELLNHASVKYISNGVNLGIAAALNIASREALSHSFDYLLTMDQDSSFVPGQFQTLLEILAKVKSHDLGILSPLHGVREIDEADSRKQTVEVSFTMTSGNLLSLSAYREAGEFDDSLFIDHVDHEYCFRLATKGFKVLLSPQVQLNHELGRVKTGRMLWIPLNFVSHSPIRTYYMIRNGLIVASKYRREFPSFYRQNLRLIFKEIGKIPFESEKGKRIKLTWLAIKHFLSSKTGKLNY